MTRMNAERFTGAQILDHQFPRKLEPGSALAADMLKDETASAKDSRAQRLLESDANLNLRGRAKKPMAVNHVFMARADLDRHNVSGKFCRKRQFARPTHGAIFGHEKRSAACDALQRAPDASSAGKLRMRGHLNRAAHPGKLAGFGNDGIAWIEDELQDRRRRAYDLVAHPSLLIGWKCRRCVRKTVPCARLGLASQPSIAQNYLRIHGRRSCENDSSRWATLCQPEVVKLVAAFFDD